MDDRGDRTEDSMKISCFMFMISSHDIMFLSSFFVSCLPFFLVFYLPHPYILHASMQMPTITIPIFLSETGFRHHALANVRRRQLSTIHQHIPVFLFFLHYSSPILKLSYLFFYWFLFLLKDVYYGLGSYAGDFSEFLIDELIVLLRKSTILVE